MPENSIPGFIRAIDIGCDFLEMDVVLTSDKEVVVCHDPYLNPSLFGDEVLSGPGSFLALDHKTLSSYIYGMKRLPEFPEQNLQPVHISSLKDILQNCAEYAERLGVNIGFNVELKHERSWTGTFQYDHEILVDRVIEVIDDTDTSDSVVLQSFNEDIIELLDRVYPGIKKGMVLDRGDLTDPGSYTERFEIAHIAPWFEDVTHSMVDRAHKEGVKVIPWTVNSIEAMSDMISLGVDGIITDNPARLKALI